MVDCDYYYYNNSDVTIVFALFWLSIWHEMWQTHRGNLRHLHALSFSLSQCRNCLQYSDTTQIIFLFYFLFTQCGDNINFEIKLFATFCYSHSMDVHCTDDVCARCTFTPIWWWFMIDSNIFIGYVFFFFVVSSLPFGHMLSSRWIFCATHLCLYQ